MKLITKQIEKALEKKPLYSTDGQKKKVAICKFFTPWAGWTWYVYEGEKEGNDWTFFGLVDNNGQKELGYFSLKELESVTGPFGLKIERDTYFFNQKIA